MGQSPVWPRFSFSTLTLTTSTTTFPPTRLDRCLTSTLTCTEVRTQRSTCPSHQFIRLADLYGNDDTEYAAPPEQAEAPEKSEPQSPTIVKRESTPPLVKPVATAPPATSSPPKAEPEPSLSPVEQISPQTYDAAEGSGYGDQATQQIPTYQDNESNEYREPPPNRPDQSYSGAQNRPVRPSEMKEEG